MPDRVLAVDLGGTNIRMAAVAPEGVILHQIKNPTPNPCTLDALLDLSAQMADECRAALHSGDEILGVAYGVPANVTSNGVLQGFANIPALNGVDLRSALRDKFELPITIENDATAAAIGEHWLGAAKGIDNWIMVTLGTGVGGGIFVNGEPLRGPDGGAAKIGHICVEPDGHPCGCGSNGCIEQYASATAMERMAKEAGMETTNSHEVFDAWKNGDEPAKSVFERMGRYLGITLGGLVNTFNPELIVIGGGAAAAWDAFIAPLNAEIKYRAFDGSAARARIVKGMLGDDAGILGAARSAFLEATS
ncbi:MAG: ROK family protein [Acidobacteria bacterium]|nr:ROK family protein [Acidobacteriota bacterium]